ncbi:MAG TPA: hypothetical protein CFH84_08275 [Sulfurimonas sp. UBA12504]|nr:MAG: hypothetical protein A2019_00190 [Sulfurimonas sp. GWF2_37_8]DAB29603.1 MAG TPA: hypothetical protein CFH84_08275 [Sulfurimonas sp. UBA12504]
MKTAKSLFLASSLLYGTLWAATLNKRTTEDSLIVYNSNIGLVHEQRELSIIQEEKSIVYEGVASSIDVDSINVILPQELKLKSQQYRFDKLTQNKLLEAHIDKKIEVRLLRDGQSFKIISATLLSSEGTKSIVRAMDGNILTVNSDDIIFHDIPQELITKASLVWNVDVQKDINAPMELDYLIKNISWQSNYILNIFENEASLDGWISIDNRSGKAYDAVDLYLLAGDINRATQTPIQYKEARAMALANSVQVTHQAHEGYHFYTVPFKVSLANNEKTQIKFISKTQLPIQRKLRVLLSDPRYLSGQEEHSVLQYVRLSALDIALPKGVVHSFSKLGKTNILLGESLLAHTPKESDIELELGKSFDVKVTESIESRDDDTTHSRSTIRYLLKNSSNEAKTVKILIPFMKSQNAQVETEYPFTFTHGERVTLEVPLEAMGTKEIFIHFNSQKVTLV